MSLSLPLGSGDIWHHVNVLREQNNLRVHCEITHLIAHKSPALTKASCWPFIGRADSARRSCPSPLPCEWPAALYLDVPENQDVVRSTKILPPRGRHHHPECSHLPDPRPAYGSQSWLDLPAESVIIAVIGGHDRWQRSMSRY